MTEEQSPMTTHDSTSWNVHRETLRKFAHEVDGIAYIGGRGTRLDAIVEQTYVEEAHQLGNDLAECLTSLPASTAQYVLDAMKGTLERAAGGRHDTRSAFVPDTDTAETTVIVAEPIVVETAATASDQPAVDPGLKRARRRKAEDAAAALAEHREPNTGEVDAIVATGA